MVTQTNSPKPHSVEYGCAKLGLSRATFYNLVNSGRLRTYKVGKARRVSDAAIAECIALLEADTAQSAAQS